MSLESVTEAVRGRVESGGSGLGATVLFDFGDDGVLFIDYLTPLKRNIILRKLTKWKKQNAA